MPNGFFQKDNAKTSESLRAVVEDLKREVENKKKLIALQAQGPHAIKGGEARKIMAEHEQVVVTNFCNFFLMN